MNIFEKLTNQFREIIDNAISLALNNKNQEVNCGHLAMALCVNSNSILNAALNSMNVQKDALMLEIKSLVDSYPKSSNVSKENITISKSLLESINLAEGYAVQNGDTYVAVDAWIIANIAKNEELNKIFKKYLDVNELIKTLQSMRNGAKIETNSGDENLDSLAKFGIDLTKKALDGQLDPIIGRDEEITRMMQILIRKTKNNVNTNSNNAEEAKNGHDRLLGLRNIIKLIW